MTNEQAIAAAMIAALPDIVDADEAVIAGYLVLVKLADAAQISRTMMFDGLRRISDAFPPRPAG